MVIDTGIFIEHIRAKDKANTQLATLARYTGKYVSSATVYELHCGATTTEKAAELTGLFNDLTELAIDHQVAVKAAKLFITLRRRNQLIGPLDILIAATAGSQLAG